VRLAVLTVAAALLASASVAPDALPAEHPRPNVVFILTDDLSWDLVQFMPHVKQMQRDGMTFTNYFVTDSLCCPSRASIFTGKYPHNHHVLTNTAPVGGFRAFRAGAESTTFATKLWNHGYRTSIMGKYLNGYQPYFRRAPGWSNWLVSGGGYKGFNYNLSANGRVAHFGRSSRAYMTDVLRRRGKGFIARAADAKAPFMIEIATFAPHRPATPAPRDRHSFQGLQLRRTPIFDAEQRNAPKWLRNRPSLSEAQISTLNTEYRKRAQSVQAVDELVGQVRRLLKRRHLTKNTYVVFSSDNGYHLGDRRLLAGKMTAFDSDIRVPLIVVGPGVRPGSVTDELAENIDLAPTFIRLAKARPPISVDGHSLVPLLHGTTPSDWRDEVLIEHHHPTTPNGDPDRQAATSGNPPSYEALRTAEFLYVEYVNGEREYYDLTTDPNELDNRYDELDWREQGILAQRVADLVACAGSTCREVAAPDFDAVTEPAAARSAGHRP
jgi:arylsulfatase A-like enzyme